MKRILLILLLLLTLLPLSATSDSYVFPLDSPVYDKIDTLYVSQGLSTPSSSRPWSLGETEIILSRLKVENMNEWEKKAYFEIKETLDETMRFNDDDSFYYGAYLDTSFESYIHTNEDFDIPEMWIRGFEERKPLLRLRLDAAISNNFYTYCDLQYGMGRVTKGDKFVLLNNEVNGEGYLSRDGYIGSYEMENSSHMLLHSQQYSSLFSTNVPPRTAYFDFVWPKRAFVSFSGSNWNLQYGRDRIRTGLSRTGSLLLDDHSDFNDHATLSFYSNRFKYTWRNVFLNGITANGESAVKESRVFMIHTLEFRPFDSLSIMISEDLMYRMDGKEAIDFSFFNPGYIYHNLNNRSIFNAIAYMEMKWSPVKNWEVYGQFVLDQATAPNESNNQTASWGLSLGGSYRRITEKGILNIYTEGVYTTPVLYRRDKVDFIKCMRYFHLTTYSQLLPDGNETTFGSNALSFEYLGFKYGGDALLLSLGGDYSFYEKYKIAASLSYLGKGEMNIFSSHNNDGFNDGFANYDKPALSGKIKHYLMISTQFEGDLSSFVSYPSIKVGAQLDWVGIISSSFSQDTQISLYSALTF